MEILKSLRQRFAAREQSAHDEWQSLTRDLANGRTVSDDVIEQVLLRSRKGLDELEAAVEERVECRRLKSIADEFAGHASEVRSITEDNEQAAKSRVAEIARLQNEHQTMLEQEGAQLREAVVRRDKSAAAKRKLDKILGESMTEEDEILQQEAVELEHELSLASIASVEQRSNTAHHRLNEEERANKEKQLDGLRKELARREDEKLKAVVG